ncbi:MAG: hypothetical protein LBE62_10600 [Azonexus sp.]|jgi:hypothetical protein|nr:hypothetical protein [Azonexus sp.]
MTDPSSDPPEAAPPRAIKDWRVMAPLLAVLLALVGLGVYFEVDKSVIVGGAVLFGMLSSLFTWLLGVLGLIPLIGPLLVKVLALPLIWLLNAIGYLLSFIAIKRGYSRDILTYRGLTVALIVGIIIGFIIGRLV